MCAPFPQLLLITLGLVPYCLLAVDPLTMVLPQWLGAVPSGCNPYLLWTGLDWFEPCWPSLALQSPPCCEPCGLKILHIHKPRLYESCGLMCAPCPQLLLITLGLVLYCLLAVDPLTMVLP